MINPIKSRTVLFIYCLFFALLAGCRGHKSDRRIKVSFSQGLNNHPYRDQMNRELMIQASLHGVDLKMYKADGEVKNQKQHIEEISDSGTDVVIVSPIDQASLRNELEELRKNKIPVIMLDRTVTGSYYTTYIGADNRQIGRAAARYILSDNIKEKHIIEIAGEDYSSPSVERSHAFREAINSSDAELIRSFKGLDEDQFLKYVLALPKRPYYLFAINDDIAYKAWNLLRKENLQSNFKIIGVDGLFGKNQGIELVMNGVEEATFLYPTGAAEAMETAVKLAHGETVPRRIVLNTTPITIANAEIMQSQLQKIAQQQSTINKQIQLIALQTKKFTSQKNLLYGALAALALVLTTVGYCIYLLMQLKDRNRRLIINNERITVQRNQIQKIAAKLNETNEERLWFFTGLSHEFKTPITLIAGAVDILRNSLSKNSTLSYELQLIDNNSSRLLHLIDNLLDFRKISDHAFSMRVSETNIYKFSVNIFNEFISEAKKRNITYSIMCDNKDNELKIDRGLMEKVYYNIISNAMKFTPDNGKVEINIKDGLEYLEISFKDNGIGIPPDELNKVFSPYFKASNNHKNGSGIGLALCKKFVELHHGKLTLTSSHGTEVTVAIPKNDNLYRHQPNVIEVNPQDITLRLSDISEEETAETFAGAETSDKPIVLVVEDHYELRLFLKKALQGQYTVWLSDGSDVLQKVKEGAVELIVCDINLDGESGLEICRSIKSDLRTSNIPIILLTALDDKDMVKQGLAAGADAYITKPFSMELLLENIKNLLSNREMLRHYYTNNFNKVVNGKDFENSDQAFILALNKVILDNLSDADFSVERLSASLKLSRIQLYRKIKTIFNISAVDYISEIRLNEAYKLLQEDNLSISEIAYRLGFSSPGYFSTVFKSKYGMTPKSFRKSFDN